MAEYQWLLYSEGADSSFMVIVDVGTADAASGISDTHFIVQERAGRLDFDQTKILGGVYGAGLHCLLFLCGG